MRLQRAWRTKQRELRRDLREMEVTRQKIIEGRRQAEASLADQRQAKALKNFDELMFRWERSYAWMERRLEQTDRHVKPVS